MFSDVHWNKEIRVVYLEEATCSQKPTIIVIIHSKYFAISDWLQSPGLFLITTRHLP